MIPTIAPFILPMIYSDLHKKYSKLELEVFENLSEELVNMLQKGTLDAAIMAFPYDAEGIDHLVLYEEAFVLACPKGYWNSKAPLSTSDLEKHNLLLLEEGHCLTDHALDACNLIPSRDRKKFSATSLATLMQMVNSGFGVTLLPKMAVQSGSVPANIDLYEFESPAPTRKIGIAWRTKSPLEDTFRNFGKSISHIINN
jgi:LysR family hydrogen peroxide-inducible transcriptional activator